MKIFCLFAASLALCLLLVSCSASMDEAEEPMVDETTDEQVEVLPESKPIEWPDPNSTRTGVVRKIDNMADGAMYLYLEPKDSHDPYWKTALNDETEYFDETGAPCELDTLTEGMCVKVIYPTATDRRIATSVSILNGPVLPEPAPFEPIHLSAENSQAVVDINGDGVREQVQLLTENGQTTFQIEENGGDYSPEIALGDSAELWVCDLNEDHKAEFYLCGTDSTGHLQVCAWSLESSALKPILFAAQPEIGRWNERQFVAGYIPELYKGQLTVTENSASIGTYNTMRHYRLNENGLLQTDELWLAGGDARWTHTARELPVLIDGIETTLPIGVQIAPIDLPGENQISFETVEDSGGRYGTILVEPDTVSGDNCGWQLDGIPLEEYFTE